METKSSLINPFELIGKLHNEGLEYAFKLINEKTTIEQGVYLSAQYLQNLTEDYTKNTLASYYGMIAEEVNRSEKIPFEHFLNELLEIKVITQVGIELINEINNIPYDSENIVAQIEDIEQRILKADMTTEEQRYPLIFASVCKNSAIFGINNSNLLFGKRWPWKADGRASIEGFAAGVATGIVTGLIEGACITIGGLLGAGFLSAIGGGIGKSLVSWIRSLFT